MTDAPSADLTGLVRDRVLDAELAGLLAVLLEAGLPLVVAGGPTSGRDAVARAFQLLRPAGAEDPVELAATDDSDARATARRFVGAAAEGLPVIATIAADDLEGVLSRLEAVPIELTRDDLSHLGIVLVLGRDPTPAGARSRVMAAHWVRPLTRDGHGHVQRLGPAVLAIWEPRDEAWEHFAWGVLPELALRLGRGAGDLEREAAARAEQLAAPDA